MKLSVVPGQHDRPAPANPAFLPARAGRPFPPPARFPGMDIRDK